MALDRKPIPKKDVLKLQPGTLVRIMWSDAPDTVELLLAKPQRGTGYVSLHTWSESTGVSTNAAHVQVLEVLGSIDFEVEENSRKMYVHTTHGTTVIHL